MVSDRPAARCIRRSANGMAERLRTQVHLTGQRRGVPDRFLQEMTGEKNRGVVG